MNVFDDIDKHEHEQVVFCSDVKVGLRAIIAIHNTSLGPSLGGTRMWKYANEDEALNDALRLSRGMTYKAAIAGLNLGGGKAVIIADPEKDKSEAMFRTFGRFVDTLGGRYITAEDVGTSVRDMEWVRMETQHVTGISRALGGSGDPSPVTSLGVYMGMKATAHEVFGSDSLRGKKISIQGAGKVATHLAEHLAKEGAKLFVTDIHQERGRELAKRVKATFIKPDRIYGLPVDMFAPCALGGILNDDTIPRLRCRAVAGGANNQLLEEKKHAAMLTERKIAYAPDYAINAGGLINVANELEGYSEKRALQQAEGIYDILRDIFRIAKTDGVHTTVAANTLAEQRILSIGRIKQIYSAKADGGIRRH
ncbi:MAG: leucine dehydrogenase [Ignavibacteria bacterium GWA2_55_11]|nr:MAG: leucine dehydrogenase [Ignavibacteria bacterium GWA2_55_11]OGU45282.1 MAG: leucine dehydrogenase [Ignavibacteria bacterium GWC2_56_12]OGU75170.1 MAG: leucine dehydrogenase [Ignavibacteria bacterium RIFCSPLOWO2_02_FULL_55_14]HAV22595.1 leucine dehydrogenase [Bacteroidota bacterium]